MREFLSSLYREKILPGLRQSKEAVRSLTDLPERCRALEREIKVLQRAIDDHQRENSGLRGKVTQLTGTLATTSRETADLKSQITGLQGNLEARDEERSHLRGEVSRVTEWAGQVAAWAEDEDKRAQLTIARSHLLVTLERLSAMRTRERDAETIKALAAELNEMSRHAELVKTLHRKALEELEAAEEEVHANEKALELTLGQAHDDVVQAAERAREADVRTGELSRDLEDTILRVVDLDKEYRGLMADVRKATRHIVEKLIDKGLSTTSIVEIVPDIGGIFPQKKILELEESIRQHNAEQEALLGLGKLRKTGPRIEDLANEIVSSDTGEGERRTFFERIFLE